MLGAGGIAEGIAPGAVVLDCSTIAPDTARRVAAALAERGAGAVDAPVSGGSEGARKGQLTAFVGGEDAHVAFARPALEAFCRSITHLGGPGAGPGRQGRQPGADLGHLCGARRGPRAGRARGAAARGARRGARRRRGGLVDPPEPLGQRDPRQLSARLPHGAAPQGPAHRAGRGRSPRAADGGDAPRRRAGAAARRRRATATRTPRRSRASRAARSRRDRALPADPRGHGRRAPALGRARLPGRRHGSAPALARRARRPARADHVRERARHGRPGLARARSAG